MSQENNKCIYCGIDNNRVLYPTTDIYGDSFSIRKCSQCNAYYLSPRPDEKALSNAYDTSYYGKKDEKFNSILEKVVDFYRSRRAGRIVKHLPPKANVLDIGCGNGRFLSYLLKHGDFNLFGVELDGGSAKRAAKINQINLKIGQLEKNDFQPETFHAITLFHVFEHLSNPKEIIEIIASIIRKNGTLVMSFPNIESKQSQMFKGNWLHLDPPRHLFFFAPDDFVELVEGFGFKLIKTHYFSIEHNPFGMVQSLLNSVCRKRELLFERLKINNEYGKEYSPIIILLHKMFFVCSFPLFIITDIFASKNKNSATVELTLKKI